MEITNEKPISSGANDNDKLKDGSTQDVIEENGNVLSENKKPESTADTGKSRGVDKFFNQQSRGDIPSPIKPDTKKDDVPTDSLNLRLDETCTQQADTTHVQPEDLSVDFTDLLEVNILETSADNESKLNQTQAELLNESVTSRKRPQDDMEPAVFEVPRMSKHPHTDSPPLPEFRDDSEPLIQFSSDSENVFRVGLPGPNANESVEAMSFQDAPEVRSAAEEAGDALEEKTPVNERDVTFTKKSSARDALEKNTPVNHRDVTFTKKSSEEHEATQDAAERDPVRITERPRDDANSKTRQNTPSAGLQLLISIDEALDPIARAIYPCLQRKPGFNTAFVCIPLVVASLLYFYFRN